MDTQRTPTHSPDEIKKGLECCTGEGDFRDCNSCPYLPVIACQDVTRSDALAYIQQLEAERDALIGALERGDVCSVCKYEELDEDQLPCATCCGGRSCWEWRGVQKEE